MKEKQKELKKGCLIVLEGIDGCGKTTQAKRLVCWLIQKGFDAVFLKEPSEGPWGRLIKKKAGRRNGLTPLQEFELFQKDRKENVELNIKPALKNHKIVVLDRYYFSTIAYQGAKGIDRNEIKERNDNIAVPPDLVIILDIDAKSGLNRIKGRKRKDGLFEREDYLQKVGEIFQSFSGERIIHLDGKKSRDQLFLKIKAKVMDQIKKLVIRSHNAKKY